MREIKFRVWDKKRREIRQSHNLLIDAYDGSLHWQFGYNEPEPLLRDEFELMQFTGLKDKTGKEIYEGDILLRLIDPAWGPVNFKVVMSKRGFWALQSESGLEGLLYDNIEICEVIGNIYENPGLLNPGGAANG